jgi:signal transduction histidine kinase
MKHLFRNNFLIITGVVLFTLVILGFAFISLSYSFLRNERLETIDNTASVAAANARAGLTYTNLSDITLKMTLISIADAGGTHIIITDEYGTVMTCSDIDLSCPDIGKTVQFPQNLKNDTAISDLGGLYSELRNVAVKTIYYPDDSDTIAGYAFASSELTPSLFEAFAARFLFVSAISLIIAAFLALPITKRQIAPVQEMAASIEQAEQARREFVANVSHELRTPITSIAGFTEALLDGTIPYEKQAKYLTSINDEINRLNRLVQRMLEITRYQSVNPLRKSEASFDITELTRRALFSLEVKINAKQLSVNALLPEEPLYVIGEEDAFSQIVHNILDNAIKFSAPQSELFVRIWKTEGKAHVSIKDHGETIPPDELPLIFDRFHKSDRSRGIDKDGIGLGLHIVKSILDSYGESISVTSENGETEFMFTATVAPH